MWQGLAFGAHSGVRKNITYRKQTEKNKIQDFSNGAKIGASNIVGGNQLRFQISAHMWINLLAPIFATGIVVALLSNI